MKVAVRVHVDRDYALAIDPDRQTSGLWLLRAGRIQHAATAKGYSCRGSTLQEIPAGGHWLSPSIKRFPAPVVRRLILDFFAGTHCQAGSERAIIPARITLASPERDPIEKGRNPVCACFTSWWPRSRFSLTPVQGLS